MIQASGYCYVCRAQTMHTKPRVNHVLHLILTVLTVGLWSVVWVTLAVVNGAKQLRCVVCGTPQISKAYETLVATHVGWHPDPYREAPLRYWDGQHWTEHTQA